MNNRIIIAVLAVLLLGALVYIGIAQVRDYQARTLVKQQTIYRKGIQAGYELSVKQLVQQLSSCKIVPVFADNKTVRAVAVECLQKANTTE